MVIGLTFNTTTDAKLESNDSTPKLFNPHEVLHTQCPHGTQLSAGGGIPFGGAIMTIYDEADRPIEMQTRDANGQTISRIIRTYNAAGLLVEENPILENPAPMFLDRIFDHGQDHPSEAVIEALKEGLKMLMRGRAQPGTWHTYDAQHRVTSVHEINFAFERTTEFTCNEHGDKAEERRTISGNSIAPIGVGFSIEGDGTLVPNKADAGSPESPQSPFDSIEPSVLKYSYQYDDRGNWTELVINHNSGGGDSLLTVSRRTITYY